MDNGVRRARLLTHGLKTQCILEITSLGTRGTNTKGMLSDQHNVYLTLSPFFILDYDLGSQIL